MGREHKLFKGKTLAILTGGGDTPALNSSIESIRNRASLLGFKVYGIRFGWKGLLGNGDIIDLTDQPYDGFYGGTALKSSRTNPFPSKKNPESRVPQVLKNLEGILFFSRSSLFNHALECFHLIPQPGSFHKIKVLYCLFHCFPVADYQFLKLFL